MLSASDNFGGGHLGGEVPKDRGALSLKYNPHRMGRTELLATLTGREEILKHLVAHLRGQRGVAQPRHLFLYGPRGIGKTTLLLALRYSIEGDPGLREAFEVVQLSEEERRVSNLPSFAFRLLELLSSVCVSAGVEPLRVLLVQAQKEPDSALDRLIEAGKRLGGKQVVFLLDNFDELAIAAVSRKQRPSAATSQSPLARLQGLFEQPSFLFVATALRDPARRRDFPRSLLDRFEQPIHIGPVTGAVELVRKRAALAGREEEILQRPGIAARLAGLNRLTGGNPRLLVYLYEHLDALQTLDLERVIQHLVDELTPMYQDVIDRLLNRGQGAVLEALAARGGVGRVKEIAAGLFLDEQTVRTFLGDLCDLELVVRPGDLPFLTEGEGSSSRETVFRTFPPLFQIWYEMRHLHRENSLFLVHFLGLLIEEGEARTLAQELRSTTRHESRLVPVLSDVADLLDPAWSRLRSQCVDRLIARGGTLRDAAAELDRRVAEEGGARRLPFLVLRAEVRQMLGDPAAAEADLLAAKELVEQGGAIEERVKVEIAQSQLAIASGRLSQALEFSAAACEEAGQVVSASADELKALAWLAQSEVWSARGEVGEAVEQARRADQSAASSTPRVRQRIDLVLGSLLNLAAQADEAEARLQRARRISIQLEDHRGEALALHALGHLALTRGEYPLAEKLAQEGRILCLRIGDRKLEAGFLREQGVLRFLVGDLHMAREHLRAALQLSIELADLRGTADAHGAIADLERSEGRLTDAAAHTTAVLAFSRDVEDRSRFTLAMLQLGAIRGELGDFDAALALLEQSLALATASGNVRQQSAALADLGAVLFQLGQPEQARVRFDQALEMSRRSGDRTREVQLLHNLGGVYLESGDVEGAKRAVEESLNLARALGFQAGQASALVALGDIALNNGEPELALGYLDQGHAIRRELGASDDSLPDRVAALLAFAEQSFANSEVLAAETRFKAALETGRSLSAERFLASFIHYLLVPALRRSRTVASELLAMTSSLADDARFLPDRAGIALAAVQALLRHYRGDSTETAVKDLAMPAIEMFRLLRERIERPELAEARRLLDKRKLGEARRTVEGVIAANPDDFEALALLGQVLLAEGDLGGAEREAARVLRTRPEDREATLLAAHAAEMRGDFQRAIGILESLALRLNERADLEQLAMMLRRAGRFDDAARTLCRIRAMLPSGGTWHLDAEVAALYIMAGDRERAAASLPEVEAPAGTDASQVAVVGLLRVLIALLGRDIEAARGHAADVLRRAASLPPGQGVELAADFVARVREIAAPREYRLFTKLLDAVSRRVPAEAFAAEFLGESEVAELKTRLAEAGQVALAALRRGDLTSLADLSRLSTHNLGSRGALIALGDGFSELSAIERGIAFDILLGALHAPGGSEALAALGALGSNFGRLTTAERARALASLVGLAAVTTEPAPREGAIQVLNVLYPHLTPAERDEVRARLQEVRRNSTSPALAEFFRDTVPAMEPKS